MKHETVRAWTILTDLILINLAFVTAYVARYQWQWLRPVVFEEPYGGYVSQQLLLIVLLFLTFQQHKVWRRRRGEAWVDEMSRIISATASGIALMMAISFFFQPTPFSRLMLVWAMLFIVLFIGMARLGRRWILGRLYQNWPSCRQCPARWFRRSWPQCYPHGAGATRVRLSPDWLSGRWHR